MRIKDLIDQAASRALAAAGADDAPAIVKQAQRPEFGHYQINGVMGAARQLGRNPRELASDVVAQLDLPEARHVEVAGPGFVNVHLDPAFVAAQLAEVRRSERLAIEPRARQTVVIDYSAPNLMKEMHIGHLRTNSIGDALARILEFLGQKVIRANHVGDWGAQFGSLLAYLDELGQNEITTELKDLEEFYRHASARFKSDAVFAGKARDFVVRLQGGDEHCLKLWELFIETSIDHCQDVYERLDITLTRDDLDAESSYNDMLPEIVDELTGKGLITESEGALCVFLDEFKGKDGKPLPAIVRKSDGGYPYMATDLAAVRHRVRNLGADKSLYVVGAPQALHFQQVFAVARAAGWLEDRHDFRHLPFGNILKEDGKMFKTREGADVKLADVIDEAVRRARTLVSEKDPDLEDARRNEIARVVGIGAIKYAELSKNRTTDYVFDWDTLLSFEGNTAPYLQYAYTRVRSVFKRAAIDPAILDGEPLLDTDIEMQLGVKLLQFGESLDAVLEDYQANILCAYLFELAGIFMTFYESCPVLKADEPTRTSRLILCDLTARTIRQGLELLGIRTVEQM